MDEIAAYLIVFLDETPVIGKESTDYIKEIIQYQWLEMPKVDGAALFAE